jgi:hypothetical protein
MDERARRLYLGWVSGREIAVLAREEGLSRSQANRIIKAIRESGEVIAHGGVASSTVSGPFTAEELAEAIRTYLERVGIRYWPPPAPPSMHPQEGDGE